MLAAEAVRPVVFPFQLSEMFDAAKGSRHLAVAVSGGSDSLALLHLAKCWSDNEGVRVTAITVDHGLRPESAGEAQVVEAWAAALGVPHVTLAWPGDKPRTGLQAAARKARYDLMSQWCRDNHVDFLLTGHTMNDQAETVAMRLKRTSTDESIAGIRPEIIWNQIRVLRPLLQVKREALRDLLRGLGQRWIDDPSNDNMAFERVRVRLELDTADVDALARQAAAAQLRAAETDHAVRLFAAEHVETHVEGYFSVARAALLGLTHARTDTLIRMLLRSVGGDEALREERVRLGDWLKSASGIRRTLGGAVIAKRKSEVLFMREPARVDSRPQTIFTSQALVWDNRFEIFGPVGSQIGCAGKITGLQRISGLPRVVFDALPVLLDASGLGVLALDKPHSRLSSRFLGLR